MNSKFLIIFVLLLVATGCVAKQCYQCINCPNPFKKDADGVTKVNIGDDDYCFKSVALTVISKGSSGKACVNIPKTTFCCQGDLCNGATTAAWNVKVLTAMAAAVFALKYFY